MLSYDAAKDTIMVGMEGEEAVLGDYTLTFRASNGEERTVGLDELLSQSRELANGGQGTDAAFTVTVNGRQMDLTRSSNTVSLDGMDLTLKGTFNTTQGTDANGNIVYGTTDTNGNFKAGEAVTFSSTADSDTIVDAIQSFVDDYNEITKAIHDAFATQPAEKSSTSHTRYEPLTEDDRSSMSESAIASYEEKAKQGILFGDSDLSSLYSRLTSIISAGSATQQAMKDIGLTTAYSGGVTTLSLNTDKLRSALESNPDKVKDLFSTSSTASNTTGGLMARLKSTLDSYASSSYASPGILVNKAGSKSNSSSLLSNSIQKQINSVQDQIERWQKKMSSKIDYYTRQFTALEQLMNTMNSQSSALAGMLGY